MAEKSNHDIVWLKSLADDLAGEGDRLSFDIIDQLLISRLELDPQGMRCISNRLHLMLA